MTPGSLCPKAPFQPLRVESVPFLQRLPWGQSRAGSRALSSGHNVLVQWKDLRCTDKDTAVKDDVAEPPGSTVSRPQVCDREQLNFIITLSPMVFFIVFFTTGTKGSGLILAE